MIHNYGFAKAGQMIGATDSTGSEPVERPVRVREVVATLYHQLGIDPAMWLVDQNRPVQLIHDAAPMPELIG